MPPDPTPEARAEQIVEKFLDDHAYQIVGAAGRASQDPRDATRELKSLLTTALRAVEQATWNSMMPYLTHRLGCPWLREDTATHPRHCTCGFGDVRRRAAGGTP